MRILKLCAAVLLTVIMFAVWGCSEFPQEKQQAAQVAFESAQTAEAETYASTSWVEAQDAMNQAEAELQAQNKKWSVLRKYGKADELFTQAQSLAEKAHQDAVLAKEQLRQETQAAFDAARNELQQTMTMLAEAPRGKDTRAEIESMQQELLGLQTTLDAAAEFITAENFRLARTQIDQVSSQVAVIKNDLATALAKVKTRR